MFTTSSALSTMRKGDYAFKIDLQDVYFHVPIHPSSRKYFRFAFENKVYQFRVLPFGLNTAPQIFGAHGDRLPPSSRDFGYSLSGRLAGSPSRPSSLVTTSGQAFKDTRPGRFYSKQKEI